MAVNRESAGAGGGSGPRRSPLVGVALLLMVLTLAGAAAVLYFVDLTPFLPGRGGAGEPPAAAVPGAREIGPQIDIREFVVNIISDDGNQYLRAAMTLEVSSGRTIDEIDERMPQIRDLILLHVSNKTFDEIFDMHGKKQLKAELLVKINELLSTGEATAIYFTDFVVQR